MIGKLLVPVAIGGGLLLLLSSSAKAETAPRNPFDVLPSNLRVLAAQAQALDLLAEELRLASRALGRLTGRVDVEDILDVIFRDFCIGK